MLDANLAHSKRVMLSPGALSRTQAWKAMRASAEASQPNGRVYTLAESWAIQPTPERLFFLVEEQYDNLPDDVHVRLVTSPSPVLAVHDKRMGFMFEGPAMESAINKLLTLVRAAVKAEIQTIFEGMAAEFAGAAAVFSTTLSSCALLHSSR